MTLKALKPLLWTDRLEETIDFYTGRLGFTCGARNDDWGWAALHRDDIEIMVARPNEHMPFSKPVFTGSLYITTDNVNELWEGMKDHVRIAYDMEAFEWGMREFAIYDNNGYMLQFGQDIS